MAEARLERLPIRRRVVRTARPATVVWGADDLLRWVFAVGVGAITIAVAWYICAGDATFNQQVGPVDAGVAGLLVTGLGNASWLLRGRRAVGERRRALLADIAQDPPPVPSGPLLLSTAAPSVAPATDLFVAGSDMTRFHRPTCALAQGRVGWVAMDRQEHEQAGRQPCGVCRP